MPPWLSSIARAWYVVKDNKKHEVRGAKHQGYSQMLQVPEEAFIFNFKAQTHTPSNA